jgi:hypothetical protein
LLGDTAALAAGAVGTAVPQVEAPVEAPEEELVVVVVQALAAALIAAEEEEAPVHPVQAAVALLAVVAAITEGFLQWGCITNKRNHSQATLWMNSFRDAGSRNTWSSASAAQ